MTKVNGKVHVEFWDDTVDQAVLSSSAKKFYYFDASTEAELESGLLKIGYVVTNSATYSAVWDLTEHQLDPGETRHYKVYSSIKNTFQYYENEYLKSAGSINVATNTVYLEYANTGLTEEDEAYKEAEEASAQYTTINKDFGVEKSVDSINGEWVEGDTVDVIYEGSVVRYTIDVYHYGNGEAEDITAIDYLYNQILLVPLEKNMEAIAGYCDMDIAELSEYIAYLETNPGELNASGFVFVGDELYFSLESLISKTTYTNVWIDDTHCAAEVTNYGDARYTEIIWSYDKQLEDSTVNHFTYYTYAGSVFFDFNLPDTYSASNKVYLNMLQNSGDRSSTLYDEIASIPVKTGTLQKQILVSKKDAEEEVFSDTSQIDLNDNNHYKQTVRYKLELDTSVTSDSDIVFSEVIDVLPYTYGVFSWEKYENGNGNVKVESVVYADGSGKLDIDYDIYYSNAEGEAVDTEVVDGVVMMKGTTIPAYQSIRWSENDKYQVTVPKGTGGVWIYVELTFELSADEWEQYADKVSGYLTNTLSAFVGDNTTTDTASVTHTVKTDSEAYLQKGVLAISDTDYLLRYYVSIASDTRKIYYNSSEESDCPSVAYYITIYNPSSAYLYLTEIQDLVPEGFTLVGYCGGLDAYVDRDIESPNSSLIITTDPTSPAAELDVGDDKVTWISARVKCTLDTETGIVRYTFSQYENLNTTVKYSEEFDCCYLAQYEAISFIVVFDPGTAEETEYYATNTIGMPYVDVSGSGVSVGEVEGTAAVAMGLEDAEQNVGVCSKYSETEAVEMGFESVARAAELSAADDNEWLVSEVTVHRGEIIPGIKKSVSADAESGVGEEDKVTWTIEITNDGTIPMINYTITDTIDAPYQISGNVYLTIYDADNQEVAKVLSSYSDDSSVLPFLTITREAEGFVYQYCRYGSSGLTQKTADGLYDDLTTPDDKTGLSRFVLGSWRPAGGTKGEYYFKITKTEAGDVFTLNLKAYYFAIPVGGKLELTIETEPSKPAETGVYYNEATVTPTQAYRDAAVTSGQAVSAEDSETDHQYVSSSDYVVVTGGYSTSSQKWIQSNEDGMKIANSEMDNSDGARYIVLDD
ncbi:MAG: hypothetical protein LUH07_03445, partial [Lachnospiraceae bacterium]|nr:hypothetical protein [Lachnospiraceae bacterium]